MFKRNNVIIVIGIMMVICLMIYVNRNNSFKGDLYYIQNIQKNNSILYNGEKPTTTILKTINYNKDIKIVFWKDNIKGYSCSFIEHFGNKWVPLVGSGIGSIIQDELQYIEFQPLNHKYKKIYVATNIISEGDNNITLKDKQLSKIYLNEGKYLVYEISNEALPDISKTIIRYK